MRNSAASNNDLKDFIDTAAIGLSELMADGTIAWANPTEYESLGYRAEEYLGRNILEFHVEREVITDLLRRLRAGERVRNVPARLRGKDGTLREVRLSGNAKLDDKGQPLRLRFYTVDVSGQTLDDAEARIEGLCREVERLTVLASRDRGLVESILNVSPYGIIACDKTGRLILQNKAAERIWAGSASAENIEGWGRYRAFHPDGRPYEAGDWEMARSLLRGETVEPVETLFQRFDGSRGVLLGGAAPFYNPNGEIEGAVSVFTDITPLKRSEEALRFSAERYLTTLRSIADAVIATDPSGKISFMNPVAETLTHWSFEAAREKPLHEVYRIVDEKSRQPVQSPVERLQNGIHVEAAANNVLLLARDGSECVIDDSSAPINSEKGELAGVVVVFRDVTEQRREAERRQFISAASALLASSLDFASTLSAVARLAVPTISDWCGIDIVEPGGQSRRLAVAHIDPEKVKFVDDLLVRYPPDPESKYGVQEVIRSGQSQLWAEIPDTLLTQNAVDKEHLRLLRELSLKSSMIVPLRAHGRVLGAISFVSAESNRKFGPRDLSFAEELANCAALAVNNSRLYREAQQANRMKDEFLATVSHELRTPLSAILGWSRLVRMAKLSDEKREQGLETIERNARAQAQLIEDLLDVSRIISGKLRLDLRAVDLIAVIDAAVDAVRLAADAKGVRIELFVDQSAAQATGDAGRLQQVVWNLLSNAVKFTPKGGSVSVRLSRADSQTEIEVTDTGAGIDPAFLPHVFEMFRQADSGSTRAHGGLGLGLAIVRHLVELHGGNVQAMSPGLERGASFRVRLPVAALTKPEPEGSGLGGSSGFVAPMLDGLHVLVVDDEADARVLLSEILRGRGASVVAAGSAADALREVAQQTPDLIVSDVGMPNEDGYSLMRKIRELTKHLAKPIPALALTAYARTEDRTRAFLAGFQSHLKKPVDPEELLIVVATLVGRTS